MKRLFSATALASCASMVALTLGPASVADDGITLTLLHNNDGESALYDVKLGDLEVGNVAAFSQVMRREIRDARASGNSVLSVYAGDSFLPSKTILCSEPGDLNSKKPVYDSLAQALMPYDVHVLGNHEFDFGPRFLDRYLNQYQASNSKPQPFISGNLDFSKDSFLKDNIGAGILETGKVARGKNLGRVYIHTDPATKQRFGVVSATTPTLPTISSPGSVRVTTADIAATAALVQQQVNTLLRRGVDKIVLVSHLQAIANDKELISLIEGVDIAVAGGGDDLLVSNDVAREVQLLPGEAAPVGTYPTLVTDAAGITVPLVTTAGNYKYLGRIDATFDSNGDLVSYDIEKSYPRRVVPKSAAATAAGITDAVTPDSRITSKVLTPVKSCLDGFSTTVVANSEVVFLNARGSSTALGVRTGETNAGNLVADALMHAYKTRGSAYGFAPVSATNRVIALQNGGGIRQNGGDLTPNDGKAGEISRAETFDMLPFGNETSVVTGVTPAVLKQVFERSCASGKSGGGQFLQTSGLKVTCSLTSTAQVISSSGVITTEGSRVKSIALTDGTKIVENGAVVAGAPNFTVVTNKFTAEGGDNFVMLKSLPLVNLGISYEESLVAYLKSFPANSSGVPTVPLSDVRYAQQTGEGRFTWVD